MKKRTNDESARAVPDRADAIARATLDGKNLAAVALGRLGGLKGGKARAESLSAEQRTDIARKAAAARWSKDGGK